MGTPDRLQRLWAPHRMAYVTGEDGTGSTAEGGCPFCRIPTLDDRTGLVLARGETVYAVLNLHPYNPGHLMVVPYRHVAGLDELTADETVELMALHPAGGRRGPGRVVAARLQRRAQPRATWPAARWPTTCTSTSYPGGAATPTSSPCWPAPR